MEGPVVSAELQQLLVRSGLDDLPSDHHQDPVGVADCGQPMGDHKRRPPAGHHVHRLLDALLGAGVHGTRRLVQYDHWGVLDYGAGDGDLLPLPHGQSPFGPDHRLISVGERADVLVDTDGPAGLLHPLGRGVGAGERHVVVDRPVEHPRVLEDHGELLPHLGPRQR